MGTHARKIWEFAGRFVVVAGITMIDAAFRIARKVGR